MTLVDAGPTTAAARRAVAGWWLYDLANTIFSFVVLSVYFGPWITTELGAPDAAHVVTLSISMAVVAVLAPILGAMADASRRMPFLVTSTVVAVLATTFLGYGAVVGLEDRQTIWLAVFMLFLANTAYQLGIVFYDSLLAVVSTPENVGRVGGWGIGIGYFGSFAGLALGGTLLAWNPDAAPLLFALTAVTFLVFAIPCFIFVRERRRASIPAAKAVRASLGSVRRTLRELPRQPNIVRFLACRVLYADTANSIIFIMGIYVVAEFGIASGSRENTLLFGLGIAFAVLASPVWGLLIDRTRPKAGLRLALIAWLAMLVLAILIPVMDLPTFTLYIVGALLGISLGATWTSDRPLFLQMVPAEKVSQYFGLFAMASRFAAIFGPLVWALIVDVLGWGRQVGLAFFILTNLVAMVLLETIQERRDSVPPETVHELRAGQTPA